MVQQGIQVNKKGKQIEVKVVGQLQLPPNLPGFWLVDRNTGEIYTVKTMNVDPKIKAARLAERQKIKAKKDAEKEKRSMNFQKRVQENQKVREQKRLDRIKRMEDRLKAMKGR